MDELTQRFDGAMFCGTSERTWSAFNDSATGRTVDGGAHRYVHFGRGAQSAPIKVKVDDQTFGRFEGAALGVRADIEVVVTAGRNGALDYRLVSLTPAVAAVQERDAA
jgi:hypothetical protein